MKVTHPVIESSSDEPVSFSAATAWILSMTTKRMCLIFDDDAQNLIPKYINTLDFHVKICLFNDIFLASSFH